MTAGHSFIMWTMRIMIVLCMTPMISAFFLGNNERGDLFSKWRAGTVDDDIDSSVLCVECKQVCITQ